MKNLRLIDCILIAIVIFLLFAVFQLRAAQAATIGPIQDLGVQGEKLDMAYHEGMHLVYDRGGVVYYWHESELAVPGSAGLYDPRFPARMDVDTYGSGTAHIVFADKARKNVWHNAYPYVHAVAIGPEVFYMGGSTTRMRMEPTWSGLTAVITDTQGGADTNRSDITAGPSGVWVCAQSDFAIECNRLEGGIWGGEHTVYLNDPEPKNPSLSSTGNQVKLVYTRGALREHIWNGSWGDQSGSIGPCCANNSETFGNHYIWIAWRGDEKIYSDLYYSDGNGFDVIISEDKYFDCPHGDECPIPRVSVAANGTVIIVWSTGGTNSRAFYTINPPGEIKKLTRGYANYAALAVDGNTFHVAWASSGSIKYRTISVGVDPTPTPVLTPTASPTVSMTSTPTPVPECPDKECMDLYRAFLECSVQR